MNVSINRSPYESVTSIVLVNIRFITTMFMLTSLSVDFVLASLKIESVVIFSRPNNLFEIVFKYILNLFGCNNLSIDFVRTPPGF